ncbi:MAG: hypothetical protein ACOCXQ_03890 [Patescibacteria group bacterium]
MEKLGAIGIFASWIGRAAMTNPIAIVLFEIVHRVFYAFFRIPLTAIAYRHAKQHREEYLVYRTMNYKIGGLIMLVTFSLIIALNLPLWLILVFCASFALLPFKVSDSL